MRLGTLCAVGAVAALAAPAGAAIVWTGPTITFTKADFADWTLPENQDRITDGVWITRAGSQGIFNIAVENFYGPLSPQDTEWAYGHAADYQSLAFAPWVQWHMNNPPSMIGNDAVVHLISEDIYIDIKFLSWTPGAMGGGFSYERSTPIPGPSALPLLAAGALTASRRPRRRT